jgi:hypothetical protein
MFRLSQAIRTEDPESMREAAKITKGVEQYDIQGEEPRYLIQKLIRPMQQEKETLEAKLEELMFKTDVDFFSDENDGSGNKDGK